MKTCVGIKSPCYNPAKHIFRYFFTNKDEETGGDINFVAVYRFCDQHAKEHRRASYFKKLRHGLAIAGPPA